MALSDAKLGFAVVFALLFLKAVFIATELFLVIKAQETKQNKIRQKLVEHLRIIMVSFGFSMGVAVAVLGGVAYIGLDQAIDQHALRDLEVCSKADADIVGDGVLIAAWIQIGSLFFSAAIGIFHCFKTAAKEVGAGLLATQISLAISLLVPLGRHSLAPVDALLGAMVLDAQNIALSMQLVTKETLASRWQVVMVWLGQVIGLVTVGALVGGFTTTNWLDTSDCRCFSVFWWAWFTNCPSEFPGDVAPFWMYFGLRCTTVLHGAYISSAKMGSFDRAERIEGDYPCNPCQACLGYTEDEVVKNPVCKSHKRCKDCQRCKICLEKEDCKPRKTKRERFQEAANRWLSPKPKHDSLAPEDSERCKLCHCRFCSNCRHTVALFKDGRGLIESARYSEMPATVSFMCIEYFAYAVLSMATAERAMKVNLIQKTSPIYSVGQVTAIVIAGSTAIRTLWVSFFMMFHAEGDDLVDDKVGEEAKEDIKKQEDTKREEKEALRRTV
ncbi:hypothetical protein NUW58_g1794 [Xylaria curta]|uniref:Uncharacterized protein n=1 Tax=Xylaria curta TaxID=42375 RepID=A0ACC1PJZ3_9PEZI|nr:hypothetical protein NUW58_g1794 [Xylaria curta]